MLQAATVEGFQLKSTGSGDFRIKEHTLLKKICEVLSVGPYVGTH